MKALENMNKNTTIEGLYKAAFLLIIQEFEIFYFPKMLLRAGGGRSRIDLLKDVFLKDILIKILIIEMMLFINLIELK